MLIPVQQRSTRLSIYINADKYREVTFGWCFEQNHDEIYNVIL